MAIYVEVDDIIRTAVKARIETALGLNVVYPNRNESVGMAMPPTSSPWLRVTIQYRSARPELICARGRRRIRGDVIVSVFVRINDGMRAALVHADSVCAAFKSSDVAPVIFESPEVRQVTSGAGADAGWAQVNVFVPFFADEVN